MAFSQVKILKQHPNALHPNAFHRGPPPPPKPRVYPNSSRAFAILDFREAWNVWSTPLCSPKRAFGNLLLDQEFKVNPLT